MDVSPFPRSMPFYDSGWAGRLIGRCNDLVAFLRGDLTPNGRMTTLYGRRKVPAFVTDATYVAAQNEEVLLVNRAGAVTVSLLEDPDLGTYHEIIDNSGDASSNNITIARTGSGLINGAASSLTINADYGGYRLIYDKTTWIAHAL